MKEQYLCVSCERSFPTGEAVDGGDQGFRNGFLCPFCRANLSEAGESDDIRHLRFGPVYYLTMILVFWAVSSEGVQIPVSSNSYINDFCTFILLSAIPTVPFLIVNRKSVFGTRTIYTRRIDSQ
ncbi:hypothetical protein [Marinobacter nauticus]|uniref:hypothetical protein n=1 Tax=Marinobacter nauticus TaxID=2743 RepID=UPI001C97823D|nr:hypothetical protein [Marinobacter nauticus]MBY6220524.1 hypothetical protein [Marinobacter nauticus]